MTRRRIFALVAGLSTAVGVAACQGFKEAMTAHVDVAAKAGAQELSVERLSALLQNVQVPLTPEIGKAIANIWVDYQLLGEAAAKGDSLNDAKLVDDALFAYLAQQRVMKFHDLVMRKTPVGDTAISLATYTKGDFFAAQHILFIVAPTATQAQRDSVRRVATSVRADVTSANFSEMAKKYSQDPGSAARGGSLGVFQKGQMVPAFQEAVAALAPGGISGLVQTQFGYHIIRRNTLAEVKDDFARAVNGPALAKADSVYMDGLEKAGDIKFQPNAATTIKGAVADMDGHTNDKTLVATSKAGDFTVARLMRWLEAAPQKEQLAEQFRQLPDSAVLGVARQVIRNELVLRAADSAKVVLDSAEMATIHARFSEVVVNVWGQLGLTPASLADSGKTVAARERIAAARVDAFMDRLMHQQSQYVPVAPPLQKILRQKFGAQLSNNGVERAMDMASKVKAAADSARAKSRPPTEVPIGGAPPKPKPGPR